MKRFLPLLATLIPLLAQSQECTKTDYHELKDYNEVELIKKYCEDKKDFADSTLRADFDLTLYKLLEKRKDREAEETWENYQRAASDAKGCKSEMDRVLRLLSQKNVDEAKVNEQC